MDNRSVHPFMAGIGKRIVLRFTDALKNNEIPDTEIEEAAKFISVAISDIDNENDLTRFLHSLARRWECFTDTINDELQKMQTVSSIEQSFFNRPATAGGAT